ncbi:type II toxin-antitoxin system Phd/YefM family antitoxin [Niveispirillum sp. KHB5.9]|uniref:type II toxin-antitoxin system Phd/YefM family antitoxin n=1 Tax=Niveispirillum sp. KHB5.9 TaxID=3400269 RepID=UPI003A842427
MRPGLFIQMGHRPEGTRTMREFQSTEATAQLSQILDAVERGETVAITRHGRRIARLVPEPDQRRERVGRAIEELRALGRENGPITAEELLSARHEGRRG